MVTYKVVETSTVTDDILEKMINHAVSDGWELDSIQFVVHPSSKRPSMAFLLFTRHQEQPVAEETGVTEGVMK
jgi:hypothetical protein